MMDFGERHDLWSENKKRLTKTDALALFEKYDKKLYMVVNQETNDEGRRAHYVVLIEKFIIFYCAFKDPRSLYEVCERFLLFVHVKNVCCKIVIYRRR